MNNTTLLIQHTFNRKQLEINNKKVIVNQLHHIFSIGLSHSNKNDSGTFSPSIIKELSNKKQLKRSIAMDRR